jgi:CRISPR/Cas system-associated exonuclease Cas4 (RecB family)
MLKNLIYDHYENRRQYNPRTKDMKDAQVFFNPSSFSTCKRQIYFKKIAMKTTNPITTASQLKMTFGIVLHEKIQEIVKNLGILVEAEKLKVTSLGGLKFRYKTDGIIIINGVRYIMEIKTTYAQGLRVVRDTPKPEDVIQMTLYMLFEHVENGILLYVGRDNGFLVEYVIKVGDPLYRLALDKISKSYQGLRMLESNIKNRKVPSRDCEIALKNNKGLISEKFQKDKKTCKTNRQCAYCQWHDLCWQRELEEIHKHKFFINGEFLDQ